MAQTPPPSPPLPSGDYRLKQPRQDLAASTPPSTLLERSARSTPSQPPSVPSTCVSSSGNGASPLELFISIRRTRVVLLTSATVAFLLLMVFTFRSGVELKRITDKERTPEQQNTLLDDYNSYAGNIASLFGTPIELFVSAAVQVILLRFMTHAITQAVPTWKLGAVSVCVGAIATYLISNGFTAMNVQLRQREIDAVISAADLSASFNQSLPGLTTNTTHTFAETQPRNPISNTILRNAVLPRVLNQQPHCMIRGGLTTPDTDVTFGFTQRDWQTRVLQEALPAKQLRVVVTPSNATMVDNAASADMPMDASLAADLYLHGMYLMTDMFNMGKKFLNETEIMARNPQLNSSINKLSSPPGLVNMSLAQVVGFLPLEGDAAAVDENAKRDFFLNRSTASVRRHLASVANTSTSLIEMSFSHVQITQNIVFDAITIVFEIEPMLLADASTRGNATRFKKLTGCGPGVGRCLFPKALYGDDDFQYDPAAQIQAFGQCVNAVGTDELRALSFSGEYPAELDCKAASNTSFLVFSIGKRIAADAMTPNYTVGPLRFNSNDTGLRYDANTTTATNVRKVYTITIGRLSWQWNNLAFDFRASCDTNNCLGLQLPLTNTTTSTAEQRLVAGASTLSVTALSPFNTLLTFGNQRLLPLALVREAPPPRNRSLSGGGAISDILAGDVLLPHNINTRNWTNDSAQVDASSCDAQVEDRIRSTLNNHLYNEHGLQPAYTAAVFLLFENAVVKDVIPLDNKGSVTLDFTNNVRHLALWLSVPNQSVWLTLAGCALLVLGLATAMVQSAILSKTKSDSLSKITAPHVIARVMLDEGQFPPLLLHRDIVSARDSSQGSGVSHREIERFAIDSLGIKDPQDHARLAAVA